MKKILSLILAVIIGCSVFSVAGFAAETNGISSFSVKVVTDAEDDADLVTNGLQVTPNIIFLFPHL